MDGLWYYWAEGRLLPEELREEARQFAPIRFYGYELGPQKLPLIAEEREKMLEARTRAQNDGTGDTRRRFNEFLDALYGVSSQQDADRLMERVSFLGFSTRVHPFLVGPLKEVERAVEARLSDDAEVARFVEGLSAIHGYNWRNIAGTARRSYHSYGVAVDIVPRSYGKRWPYWLWAAQSGIARWWRLPLDARWPIPQPVIDAFEANGFVWGGKWLFFDNLHFEYRPESILMARDAAARVSPGATRSWD
jgi:hypothetical protein